MTESNTPPENQKKKSAFSRFFSRKKAPKPEQAKENAVPVTQPHPEAQAEKPIAVDTATSAIEPNSLEGNQPSQLTESEKSESITTSNEESRTNDSAIKDDTITNVEPTSTNQEPPESKEPSAYEEPLAHEEPSADEKPLAIKEPLNKQPSADTELSENKELSTNEAKQTEEKAPTDADSKVATVEDGLNKSRSSFFQKITNVFKGSFNLDDELFDELEELLITSDIGIDASLNLVEKLRTRVKKEKIQDADGVVLGLRREIAEMLQQSEQDWQFSQKPYVILMVGINGAGKTTTTAKIAKHFQDQGKSVMLAAADTFRAAAVEQLQEWGQRLDIPVIAQSHGSDAAAVAHDALTSAIARKVDVLMIDTAGRLHTQSDLMEQLTKVNRVLAKIDPTTPHEVMQVLDSGTGQNALTQLEHFQKAVGVSSICLSKLDGSAKGGIAISLSEKTKLPIRFIGTGEGFSDLQRFSAQEFADALVPSLK